MPDRVLATAAWVAVLAALTALVRGGAPLDWLLACAGLGAAFAALHRTGLPQRTLVLARIAATGAAGLGVPMLARSEGWPTAAAVLAAPLMFLLLRCDGSGDRRQLALAAALAGLIGVASGGEAVVPWLATSFAGGLALLYLDTVDGTRRAGRSRVFAPATRRMRGGDLIGALAACGVLVACLVDLAVQARALGIAREADAGAAGRAAPVTGEGDRRDPRTLGLSDGFDLGDGEGWIQALDDLQSARLVSVTAADGGPIPDDLYLRYSWFDLAGARNWTRAVHMRRPAPEGSAWKLAEMAPGIPSRRLMVHREPLSGGQLLLPVGTHRVLATGQLRGNAALADVVWPASEGVAVTYGADVQDGALLDDGLEIDEVHRSGLLNLPDVLRSPRIEALARRYLRGVPPQPLAQARALAFALQRDYAYARREPVGPEADPLHDFLFHDRQGFCMHFASALAVMLRLRRVPCRIGVGLHGGEPDPDEPTARRWYGHGHAHAWVELPIAGVGWVAVEATPAEGRPIEGRGALFPVDAGSEPTAVTLSAGARMALVAAVLALLLLLPWLPRRGVRATGTPALLGTDALSARRALRQLLHALAARGLPRQRGETLEALAGRVAASFPAHDLAVATADGFRAYQEVRFGGAAWDQRRTERVLAAAARVREGGGVT